MPWGGGGDTRGGRGYVGQFSRNSMGRDRHSNSRYPRPSSLEAGACSNKPQTPYRRGRIHPPLYFTLLLLLLYTVYPTVGSLLLLPVSILFPRLSRYLSVSLTIPLSLFRQFQAGIYCTPAAEVATTTQISFRAATTRRLNRFAVITRSLTGLGDAPLVFDEFQERAFSYTQTNRVYKRRFVWLRFHHQGNRKTITV